MSARKPMSLASELAYFSAKHPSSSAHPSAPLALLMMP